MDTQIRTVHITRKEKEYQGMLEYRDGDEGRLLKNVVIGWPKHFLNQIIKF